MLRATLFLFCVTTIWGQSSLEDPEAFIDELVKGNYHIECELSILRLFQVKPLFFENLQKEVLSIALSYGADIKKLALLNRSGNLLDLSSDHDWSVIGKRFFQKHRYPFVARLIALFPHTVNFRIARLKPMSQLFQHDENICLTHRITGKPYLKLRFHLPIKTNEQARMFMDGKLYHFEEGFIHFLHNGRIHDALNAHPDEERIHLVWDMLLTEETYELMFKRSVAFEELIRLDQISLESSSMAEIDPNPIERKRIYSYEEARCTTFCPLQ